MNITQYAAHRGVSRAAVHKALTKGWIQISDGMIDPADADAGWDRAKDPSYNGRGEKKAQATQKAPQKSAQNPPPASSPQPEDMPDVPDGLDYVQVRTLKEFWAAKREELKFKTEAKDLVPTPDVALLLARVGVEARNKIMGIRSKAQTRNPAITQEVLDVIDSVCREVCEDISATKLDFSSNGDEE